MLSATTDIRYQNRIGREFNRILGHSRTMAQLKITYIVRITPQAISRNRFGPFPPFPFPLDAVPRDGRLLDTWDYQLLLHHRK